MNRVLHPFTAMLTVVILLLAATPGVVRAQRPAGDSDYKIAPAIAGNKGKIFVGTQRGAILQYRNAQGVAQLEDSITAGEGLPASVDAIWYLTMPNKTTHPDLIVGLSSFTDDAQQRHYSFIKSTDLGATWMHVQSPALSDPDFRVSNDYYDTSRLASMTWVDDQHGWIYGSPGLLRTTNGGTTWEVMNRTSHEPQYRILDQFRVVEFRDADHGMAIRGWWFPAQAYYYTEDGGATWRKNSPPGNVDPYRGVQIDWIGGEYRTLLVHRYSAAGAISATLSKTPEEFTPVKSQELPAITRIQTYMTELLWANEDVGFITLRSGEFFRTQDKGKTWTKEQDSLGGIYTMSQLQGIGYASIILDNEYLVQAATANKTGELRFIAMWPVNTTVGVPYAEAGKFALASYPNPAVTDLDLRFTLESPAQVRLAIVDLFGREVMGKDLGSMGEGAASARLDVSALPSGSYRCVLSAGQTRATLPVVIAR